MSETPPTLTVTIDPRQRINAPSIALLVTGIIGERSLHLLTGRPGGGV
jgi:hypothetical protein